jgi:serine/threonine protein kinase
MGEQPPKAKPEEALIGQEISGCFIIEKISSGGMGTVFKAKHLALDRIVCVKILSPAMADDKKAVSLFLTEARAIAEINHPNIVFVYNVGKEKGFYFIVMSFIDGDPLSALVKRNPNLPAAFVIDVFAGVLQGLEAAHQKGIIHRDIKPSNILITKKLEAKIVDFGIAQKIEDGSRNVKTAELAGTPHFISPEQVLGKPIDQRADLYSVGASLFYVLTGKFPFQGKTSAEIMNKQVNEPAPNVNSYRKKLPTWVGLAINKLMNKNPDDRFQTAEETLDYFRKMRAEDQLRVSGGIDLYEEVGVKIKIEDAAGAAQKRSEFDAARAAAPVEKKIVYKGSLSSLDSLAAAGANSKPRSQTDSRVASSLKPSEQNLRRPLLKLASVRSLLAKRVVKWPLYAASVVVLPFAALFVFLKLGVLCAQGGGSVAAVMRGGASLWLATLLVLLVSAASCFFNVVRRIAPTVFVVICASFASGFYGLADLNDTVINLTGAGALAAFCVLCVALVAVLDDCEVRPLLMRLLTIILMCAALGMAFLSLFPNYYIAKTPVAQPLVIACAALILAAFSATFARSSVFFRFMTLCSLIAACATLWPICASQSVYNIMQRVEIAALAPSDIPSAPTANDDVPTSAELPLPSLPAEQSNPKRLSSNSLALKKEVFINNLARSLALGQTTAQEASSQIRKYAFAEPLVRWKYGFRRDNVPLLVLILSAVFGMVFVLISALCEEEEKCDSL